MLGLFPAPYILVVLHLMNGEQSLPVGSVPMPNVPAFETRRECRAFIAEFLEGAFDQRRWKLECIPK